MPNLPEPSDRVKSGIFAELARLEVERLEALHRITDPYDLLASIAQQQRASSTRARAIQFAMTRYGQFIGLAAQWPRADQDALVRTARSIFGVTISVMRGDLRELTRLERMLRDQKEEGAA